MKTAKRVKSQGHMKNDRYEYRGGFIERYPTVTGARKGNWEWGVCGARGWVDNKAQAKEKIDNILREAFSILQSEQAFCCPDAHLCRHGIDT